MFDLATIEGEQRRQWLDRLAASGDPHARLFCPICTGYVGATGDCRGHDLPHAGRLLLVAVVGSTAYGLAGPDSDVDRLGIYQAATPTVLGLDGPTAVKHSHVTTTPDVTLHEVGKFAALALKANPTILELLWAVQRDGSFISPAGARLVDARRSFLSAPAIRSAYGGYATQQARRLLDRTRSGKVGFDPDLTKRTAKHGRHCYRLLIMGRELLATGEITLDVSDHRDRIFEVGELAVSDPEAFTTVFEHHRARLDDVATVLPDQPDRDRINQLIIDLRQEAA